MSSQVVVLGDVSPYDKSIIEKTAASQNLETTFLQQLDCGIVFSTVPSGFISFFPCTLNQVIQLFGNLPIGTGEKIPYFQALDAGEIPEFLNKFPLMGVFEKPLSIASVYSMMTAICRNDAMNLQNVNMVKELTIHRKQKFELVQIGTSLSRETDLWQLLDMILTASRQIVCADAGSIYIRERKIPGGPFLNHLRFMVSQNDSVKNFDTPDILIPIDETSIAGYVAKNARPLNIDDILQDDIALHYRSAGVEFEKKFGYRIKSMLTLPLKNLEGEVVGVLQLLNKKNDQQIILVNSEAVEEQVMRFPLSDEEFIKSIASQVAVSIERVQLHESINALFEGFLNSSIAAIDERDKVTSGHSRRVMGYATAFANAAMKETDSVFAPIGAIPERKRQFEFAALLHDIGKIGVPEHLLAKESRLSGAEMNAIFARMDFISLQIQHQIFPVSWKSVEDVMDDRKFLARINYAGYLQPEDLSRLNVLKEKTFTTVDDKCISFLTENEFNALSVQFGNLTTVEKNTINSHAQSTYRILSQIPWPRHFEHIPFIAAQHHEKLDGSGYPEGLKDDEIFIESKILSVIDIYEALVSQDRPYKPKMQPEKALEILQIEAEKGHVDKAVVRFFIEKEIYRTYLSE